MARIDELQEAIAQIQMAVDNDQQARKHANKLDDPNDNGTAPENSEALAHWALGATK